MYLNRSCMAFTFTVEKLFRYNPQVYFWTLTFRHTPRDDTWAMYMFNKYMANLTRKLEPLVVGVRVSELHKEHGIHFHLLLNRRIPMERMKRVGWQYGFGRMGVTQADPQSGLYLAKYLTKQYRIENDFGGRRRWGTIGGFPASRCRDIEYDTDCTRNHAAMFGREQVDTWTAMLARNYSDVWGECWQWPPFVKIRFRDAVEAREDKGEITPNQRKRLNKLGLLRIPECPF